MAQQHIARKWTYARKSRRCGVVAEIRRLVVRMAGQNPTWGYTRIQGALKTWGIALAGRRLRGFSRRTGSHRSLSDRRRGRRFCAPIRMRWRARVLHDRSMDVARPGDGLYGVQDQPEIRRVQILGSTPPPDEAFMRQVGRTRTMADVDTCHVLICDRDAKWNGPVRECIQETGIRIVQTPYRAPNARLRRLDGHV
jgi:hypothetical protein